MITDLTLLKLRFEILNVSLDELAADAELNLTILTRAAEKGNWYQWWPAEVIVSEYKSVDSDDMPYYFEDTEDTEDTDDSYSEGDEFLTEDDTSTLESESQTYLRDQGLRLQVYNMAKSVHLTHKYAELESVLIDEARVVAQGNACSPQDLKNLSALFKDLAVNMTAGKTMSIGTNNDGLPEVIIRDLRGRDPK